MARKSRFLGGRKLWIGAVGACWKFCRPEDCPDAQIALLPAQLRNALSSGKAKVLRSVAGELF